MSLTNLVQGLLLLVISSCLVRDEPCEERDRSLKRFALVWFCYSWRNRFMNSKTMYSVCRGRGGTVPKFDSAYGGLINC